MLPFSTLSYFCMNKIIIKTFFIILLVSVSMLLLIPFISSEIYYITLLSFVGYFYLTLLFFKVFGEKLSTITIVVIIFATMFLLQLPTIYTWFIWDTWGLPRVVADCLSVVSAYFYFKGKQPKNILPFALSSCFVVFMFFQGWDYWLHRVNFGTFTGKVSASNLPARFESFDEQKNPLTEDDFNRKVVLLDFWTTTCGVCFQKFPQVQTVYDKYKNDSSVMILAVNKPIEEDKPNQAFDDIRKREHTFPVVVTKDEDLAEKFGVKGYPTTFVINRDGQIVYKGDIEGAIKQVDLLKAASD